MYRDLKSSDPAVEEIDRKPYLRVSTGHGRYATLEVRGIERFLFLENTGFVIAVYESLPYWKTVRLPAAYRPMHEIASAVTITPRSEELRVRAEDIELRLDAACIITVGHSKQIVSIPIRDFIIQAINHFAEKPLLDTSHLGYDFLKKLETWWGGILPAKDISSVTRAIA